MNGLNLSEKENKLLVSLEKKHKRTNDYKYVGILLIVSSSFLFVINEDNIYEALFGVIIGVLFIAQQYQNKTYYTIIKKMKDYIKEIEEKNT